MQVFDHYASLCEWDCQVAKGLSNVSHYYFYDYYLPSSSTIITLVLPVSPTITSLGSDVGSIEILKYAFPVYTLLSYIATSNEALVVPAMNVTLYGPDL